MTTKEGRADDQLTRPRYLAVCLRKSTLGLAIVDQDRVLHRQRHYLRSRASAEAEVRTISAIRRLREFFNPHHIICEPASWTSTLLSQHDEPHQLLSLEDAKQRLFLGEQVQTNAVLYQNLVAAHPELGNSVRMFTSGEVAMSDRRRNVILLAAAIGLAAHLKENPIASST